MNTLQALTTPKKPTKSVIVDNPIEALKDVGENIVDTVKTESSKAVSDMWNSILGADKYAKEVSSKAKTGGELHKGQTLDLKKEKLIKLFLRHQ